MTRDTRSIPGPPIFGIGATVTINAFFTKEQMRYYGFYSWPTAPLTVRQGMRELNVSAGEGVILNYDNGKAYPGMRDVFDYVDLKTRTKKDTQEGVYSSGTGGGRVRREVARKV